MPWKHIHCLIKCHTTKMYWGSWGIALWIFILGTWWRWVVATMPQLLYAQSKNPWYPLDRRLGGPRAGLNAVAVRKHPIPCWESNPGCPAHNLDTILIELPWKNMVNHMSKTMIIGFSTIFILFLLRIMQTLSEEHRLKVFENRLLRKRRKWWEAGEGC